MDLPSGDQAGRWPWKEIRVGFSPVLSMTDRPPPRSERNAIRKPSRDSGGSLSSWLENMARPFPRHLEVSQPVPFGINDRHHSFQRRRVTETPCL